MTVALRLVVAFDVSTPVGSVALGRPGEAGDVEVLARRFLLERRAHADRLLPAIEEGLSEVGAAKGDIGGIVVGRGPGSFTGVRIAAATARGLAKGLNVPHWARSSLAAAAVSDGAGLPPELESGQDRGGTVCADTSPHRSSAPRYILFDARGDRVYAACYRVDGRKLDTLVAPHAATLPGLLASHLPTGAIFAGDGALRHARELEAAGHGVAPFPIGLPTAEGLLRLYAMHPDRSPEGRWEPEYLRGSWGRPIAAGTGGVP